MKSFYRSLVFFLCFALTIPVVVAGKGNGKAKEKGKHHKHNSAGVSTTIGVEVFVGGDRDLIRNHYVVSRRQRSLPPGLAKRGGDLPPGLEKQLMRKGHLPPGLEKKIFPFPVELERRLPPLRPGLVRGIIGGNAVIYDGKTRIIFDIFAVL